MWFEGAWKQAEQGLLGSILGPNITARIKLTLTNSQLCRCPSSILFSSHDLLALNLFIMSTTGCRVLRSTMWPAGYYLGD